MSRSRSPRRDESSLQFPASWTKPPAPVPPILDRPSPPSPSPSQLSQHWREMNRHPSPVWSKWHAPPGKFWSSYPGWQDDDGDDCSSPRDIPFLDFKRNGEKTSEDLLRRVADMLFTSEFIEAHIKMAKTRRDSVFRYEDPIHSLFPIAFFRTICRRLNSPPSAVKDCTVIEVD